MDDDSNMEGNRRLPGDAEFYNDTHTDLGSNNSNLVPLYNGHGMQRIGNDGIDKVKESRKVTNLERLRYEAVLNTYSKSILAISIGVVNED